MDELIWLCPRDQRNTGSYSKLNYKVSFTLESRVPGEKCLLCQLWIQHIGSKKHFAFVRSNHSRCANSFKTFFVRVMIATIIMGPDIWRVLAGADEVSMIVLDLSVVNLLPLASVLDRLHRQQLAGIRPHYVAYVQLTHRQP